MTKNEANKYLCAILTTLAEVQFAPESTIYLACGADLSKWQSLKMMLVQGGLVLLGEFGDYTVSITDKGRELANKINAAVAA